MSLWPAMQGISRVYHLAAVVGDWGSEGLFRRVNVEGTRNVLDAAARAGCERVVVASSVVMYGSGLLTSAQSS
jgi:nucleoside-diphosphate-sugar epimerase